MIIIPMAGLSSRFFKEGYTQPKYMLNINDRPLFDYTVGSFKKYFQTEFFLFVVRDIFNTVEFVDNRVKVLGILEYKIVILSEETRGQAETVVLGLDKLNYQGAITIFNIDTIRPNFIYPDLYNMGDAYLEVFKGEGDNWSFVKGKDNTTTEVIETAEKTPISNLCCTGLYHFSSLDDYLFAYKAFLTEPRTEWVNGELYIAPLYNILIKENKKVHYHLISSEDVVFCGIPDEYTLLKQNHKCLLNVFEQ